MGREIAVHTRLFPCDRRSLVARGSHECVISEATHSRMFAGRYTIRLVESCGALDCLCGESATRFDRLSAKASRTVVAQGYALKGDE
jgi:hypothetical protein